MTTFTVEKGSHFSFPRTFKLFNQPKEVSWQVLFNQDCNYLIRESDGSMSRDQNDWNKLCGIFYSLFNTRKDAAMIGWRYQPETDQIELAPYYHISKSRDMFPPLVTVQRGDTLSINLKIDYTAKIYRWSIQTPEQEARHEMPFQHNNKRCSLINFYFGGNQPAPQKVSVQMSVQAN